MGRVGGGFAPGPMVLDNAALVGAARPGRTEELTLRVIVAGAVGLEASCLGAAALSARVIRFAAGGFKPVSWSLRLAPPVTVDVVVCAGLNGGAISCEVVSGSSGIGEGPRIEGLLASGENRGEVV